MKSNLSADLVQEQRDQAEHDGLRELTPAEHALVGGGLPNKGWQVVPESTASAPAPLPNSSW